jgi:hypothetical protein
MLTTSIPFGIRTDSQRRSQSIWGTFPAFYNPMGANGWGNNPSSEKTVTIGTFSIGHNRIISKGYHNRFKQ